MFGEWNPCSGLNHLEMWGWVHNSDKHVALKKGDVELPETNTRGSERGVSERLINTVYKDNPELVLVHLSRSQPFRIHDFYVLTESFILAQSSTGRSRILSFLSPSNREEMLLINRCSVLLEHNFSFQCKIRLA